MFVLFYAFTIIAADEFLFQALLRIENEFHLDDSF